MIDIRRTRIGKIWDQAWINWFCMALGAFVAGHFIAAHRDILGDLAVLALAVWLFNTSAKTLWRIYVKEKEIEEKG